MSEIVDFMKELFLINKVESTMIGLSSFRKNTQTTQKKIIKKIIKKKNNNEVRLSDLMRRA